LRQDSAVLLAEGPSASGQHLRTRSPRLARHLAVLGDGGPDPTLAHFGDLEWYVAHLALPWKREGDALVYASAGDANALCDRIKKGENAWIVRAEKAALIEAIEERFRGKLARAAALKLALAEPRLSAQRVILGGQAAAMSAVIAAILVFFCFFPLATAIAITVLLGLGFVANLLFRALLVWIGAAGYGCAGAGPVPGNLPLYTILVPMYREANMAAQIAESLNMLDYPKDRLQVIFALEQDDQDTYLALRRLELTRPFEIVRVPPGQPRTKPRACNYALNFARGEFLVINDAEDRPEPDQLKKAVAAFRASPANVACLQARLNFYNRRGWLEVMFTLDYSLWFDFLLPGLDRIGVPMPLGGTSNHLRTGVVREIMGWDPFNVTEDADLGIRLAEKGYRVSVLDSTTFEEAAGTLPNWMRQRSRWLKGYMQTWLVHMRDPRRLLRSVGWRGFVGFQLFVGGTFMTALVNPLLWAVFMSSALFGWGIFTDGNAVLIAQFSLASLILGNAFYVYLAMLGVVRRGWFQFAFCALSAPVYWLLVSLAGFRGLAQLFRRPFYWEKTHHGAFARA